MWFTESRNAKLSDCVQRFVKHNLKKKTTFHLLYRKKQRRKEEFKNNINVSLPFHFPRAALCYKNKEKLVGHVTNRQKPKIMKTFSGKKKSPLLVCLGRSHLQSSWARLVSKDKQRGGKQRLLQRWCH